MPDPFFPDPEDTEPEGLVAVSKFLRDEPDLKFDYLSCITAVDYLETDPKKAAKGTIRADFADSIDANAVHGSDSPETAATEIAYFFPRQDIHAR